MTITVAAVEGGGTSFVVAIARISSPNKNNERTSSNNNNTKPPEIIEKAEFDSSHNEPLKTLQECATFLRQHKPPGGYHALGLASFGPVGVHADRVETYGCILSTTPKAAWRNVNLLAPLREACQGDERPLAVRVETDVNAPALAEFEAPSNNSNISSLAYVTVGTGVGVGLIVNGQCVHGRMHPEGGHVPVQPLKDDPFLGYSWGGKSPFHGKQTVEGIASSVALTERLGQSEKKRPSEQLSRNVLAELPDDHPIWDHAANALANLCVTLLLMTSMECILLGGGVMKRPGLIEKVRDQTVVLLNGYLELPNDMSTLIRKPSYGDEAGLMGAVVLAQKAYEEQAEGLSNNNNNNKGGDTALSENNNPERSTFWQGFLYGLTLSAAAGALVVTSAKRRM